LADAVADAAVIDLWCDRSLASACVWNWMSVRSVDWLTDTIAVSNVTDSTDCLQVICCVVMCCAVNVEADSELTDCLQVM